MTGKWAQAGVPHTGWSCTDIEDLGAPSHVCGMCEVISIRYVHTMTHPDYPEALRVGCVCAGHMEGDPQAAHAREFAIKSNAARRSRWLSRKWRRSRAGNRFLNTNGFHVCVFPMRGGFGARVEHRWSDWARLSQRVYPTETEAALAAFDVLVAKEFGAMTDEFSEFDRIVEETAAKNKRAKRGYDPPDRAPPNGERDYLFNTDPFPQEAAQPLPELELFDVGDEDGKIPPREWLLGTTFCRTFLSGLVSAGAGGKTTIRILQTLSLAVGKSLCGEHVFVRARVLIICLEDDLKELRRRVWAAMLHHGIKPADVKGWLILTTPRKLKIAQLDARGKVVVEGPLLKTLSRTVDKHKFDLICIDPAIKAHAVGENDNNAIDIFMAMLADLSVEKNIAIDLLAHERKAGSGTGAAQAGDANRSRGASSAKDAQRLARTLTGMSDSEAKALGVSDEARLSIVRIDNAKVNIAPPSRKATWFRLVGVELGNGNATYPNGDNVQAAEPWQPPSLMQGADTQSLNIVLRKLGKGMDDGRRYSTGQAARDRAAWKVLQEQFPDFEEARCRNILATWKKNGMFDEGNYTNPERREKEKGILSAKQIERMSDDENQDF